MAATGTARVVIKAENQASGEFSKVGGDAENMGRRVAQASAIATGGLILLGGLAVKSAADFQHSMSQVGAVAGASAEEMKKLSAAALQIGRDTAFGASDAADAMQELAAGGRTVAQILGGEAKAAVDLAAAGNYGLADSGRTIATVMDVWKDTTIQTTDVVNRLAGAANASRFGVEDMSYAIAQGGGVAAAMGVSFQDFSTAVAATASSFASGADAGTSLKTMLLNLDGSTEKAKGTIAALGLEFRNTDGSLKEMSGIVSELNTKVGTLGEAQQVAALKTIFGNDAYRSAAGLMKLTGDEFTAMSSKMESTDAAAVAAQRMGNLKGDIEALKGSVETFAITTGTKAIPALRELVDVATVAVNAFGSMPESTQMLALGFTAMAVAAPAAAHGVQNIADSFKAMKAGTGGLGLQLSAIAVGIGAVTIAADALLTKVSGSGILEHLFGDPGLINASKEAVRELAGAQSVAANEAEKMATAQLRLDAAQMAFTRSAGESNGALETTMRFLKGTPSQWDEMEASVLAAAQSMVTNGASTRDLITAYEKLDPRLQDVFDKGTNVRSMMEALGEKTQAALNNATGFPDVYGAVATSITAVATALPNATERYVAWLSGLAEGTDRMEGLNAAFDALHAHLVALDPAYAKNAVQIAVNNAEVARLKAANETYSTTLGMTIPQIEAQTSALEKANGATDRQAASLKSILEPLTTLIGPAGVKTLVDDLNNQATSAGASEQSLIALANAMSTNVPAAVTVASGALDSLGVLLDSLEAQGYKGGKALIDGLVRGIQFNQGNAFRTAEEMTNTLANIIATELEIYNPSRRTERYGYAIGVGLARGIVNSTPIAVDATEMMMSSLGPPVGTAQWRQLPGGGGWSLDSVTDASGGYGGGGQIGTALGPPSSVAQWGPNNTIKIGNVTYVLVAGTLVPIVGSPGHQALPYTTGIYANNATPDAAGGVRPTPAPRTTPNIFGAREPGRPQWFQNSDGTWEFRIEEEMADYHPDFDWFGNNPYSAENRGHSWVDQNGAFHFGPAPGDGPGGHGPNSARAFRSFGFMPENYGWNSPWSQRQYDQYGNMTGAFEQSFDERIWSGGVRTLGPNGLPGSGYWHNGQWMPFTGPQQQAPVWWQDPMNPNSAAGPDGMGMYGMGGNTIIINSSFTDLGQSIARVSPTMTKEQDRSGRLSFQPFAG